MAFLVKAMVKRQGSDLEKQDHLQKDEPSVLSTILIYICIHNTTATVDKCKQLSAH